MKKIIILLLIISTTVFAQIPQLLKDINAGPGSGMNPTNLLAGAIAYNGGLIFPANDGAGGSVLWFSNGTTTGTNKIIPVTTNTPITGTSFTLFKGRVLFTSGYNEIWITDGTNAGTYQISAIPNLTLNTGFTIISNTAYFAATSPTNGQEIFKTDTVVGSASILKDIWTGTPGSTPISITDDNSGGFYFIAN
ncbi:MAG: hypothetical protein ABIP51_20315, partial [Bacteroidia bacterium]